MSPVVVHLVGLMKQAQLARIESGFTDFYPHWWMYSQIAEGANDYSPRWVRRGQSEAGRRSLQKEGINPDTLNLRSELNDGELQERQQFFSDIATAYGIAAYAQFTPRQKDQFRKELREDITNFDIGNVTLNEHQRQVLSQIATATSIQIDPTQETYQYSTILQQPNITKEELENDERFTTW